MKSLLDAIKVSDYVTVKKHIKTDPSCLEIEDEQGATLLSYAMRQRVSQELLELLILSGSNIHDIDNEGVSVIEYAITYGYTEIVKQLLEQGISIMETSRKSGFTPMMAAVSYNNTTLVELFLEQGVDLSAQDKSGFTAIDFARRMHRKKILSILENHIRNQQ